LPGFDLAIAICRKLVHKSIGGRIISLPDIPHGSGNGRKQHEEI
jgi:hypothetical protein